MNKPVQAEYNPQTELVSLFFEPRNKVPVKHYIVGAICWPVGRWPGYALVAGQDLSRWEKPVNIFEEYPFWSVGTMDGEAGLWLFFRESCNNYFCNRYYHLEEQKVHNRYRMQVGRETLINPKPIFIESPYVKRDRLDADNLILEYINRKMLKIDRGISLKKNFDILCGNLGVQLESYTNGYVENDDSIPAVQALRALIMAIEKRPYERPVFEDEEVPYSHWS